MFTNKLPRTEVLTSLILARFGFRHWFVLQKRIRLWQKNRGILAQNSSSRIFLLVIFFLGAFLRFYRIEEMFSFDFDQEAAANAAYDFIKSGKLSLIGQELSYPGFFLGPLHSWIQIFPYSLCNLKPDCIPYFFTSIGLISAYFLYLSVKTIINHKTAVISAILFLFSSVIIGSERGPSSNYFLFLVSIFMLFCLYKYHKGEKKYLIAGSFFGGLAVVNFNPIFVFTLAAYFLSAIITREKKFKLLLISFLAAVVNLAPLLIFNFRHQNLLFNNLLKFLRDSNSLEGVLTKPYFLFKEITLPYYNNFLFLNSNPIFMLITFCIILFGSYSVLKAGNAILNFLLIWIFCVLLGFSFYNRHIPDYYFIQTLIPFIVITAFLLSKNFVVFVLIMTAFFYSNISDLLTFIPAVSYKLKKEVVNRVIADSRGENFNVYYNLPRGLNTGYSYLFKAYGKIPMDYSQNLYILDFYDDQQFNTTSYYKTYNGKIKNISSIGTMKIITIKNIPN